MLGGAPEYGKENEESGFFAKLKNTKLMKIQRTPKENGLEIDGYNVEIVDRFNYLEATFTNNVEDSTEVKRRIGIAKNATIALNNIWENRGIILTTKYDFSRPWSFQSYPMLLNIGS